MNEKRFSIVELERLTTIPVRTIRFYIQKDLLDPPIGEKRLAYYTDKHLNRLLEIRRWSDAGFSLERIKELLATPEGSQVPRRAMGEIVVQSHVHIAPGIELVICPEEAGLDSKKIRMLMTQCLEVINNLKSTQDSSVSISE